MKKWLALTALMATGLVSVSQAVVIDLKNLPVQGDAVVSVDIIQTLNGLTSTNTVTPADGPYYDTPLADSLVLAAHLKPGYTNARFAYRTEAYGALPATTGVFTSGSQVPVHTVPGESISVATYVEDLLYEAVTANLSFNARGGRVEPSSKTITYDQPYGTLPVPTFEGFLFGGWSGEGRLWAADDTVKTLTNQTFTAEWTPIAYTVRFLPGEDGTGSMTDQAFTYEEKQNLAPCAFTRENYLFSCWSNTVTGVTFKDEAEVKNLASEQGAVVSLTAVWAAKRYSVEYYRNYSAGDDTCTAQTITYGETTTLSDEIGRAGYTFSGWATEPGATIAAFGAHSMVSTRDFAFDENGIFRLYAVWRAYAYSVQFFANGGAGAMAELERTFDDAQALPPCAFARAGYLFAGWAKTASGGVEWTDESPANLANSDNEQVKLYAVWQPIPYTVFFDANDEKATGEMAALPFTYGVPQKLPVCAFVKDGYLFNGWAFAADDEPFSADQATVSNLTVVAGTAVTLYARWKAEPYTVTLDANGGVFGTQPNGPATSNITVTVDEPYGAFPVVTNFTPKLVFGDWRTPAGEVVATTDTVPPPSAGMTNLVAHWVKDDPLARATDAEELDFNWTAYQAGRWHAAPEASAVGGTAAEASVSGGMDDVLTLTTQVVGPGQLTFKWKVLSVSKPWNSTAIATIWEKTAERLYFEVGGNLLWGLMGSSALFYRVADFDGLNPTTFEKQTTNPGWVEETLRIEAQPGETNTLAWTFYYFPDDPTPGHAWVDNVRWVPDEVVVTNVTVTVPGVENYTATVEADGATYAVTNGVCEVPQGSTVKVVYTAAPGYEPAAKEIDLGVVSEDVAVPAGEVPAVPTLTTFTLTVPAVAQTTPLVVANGVTNVLENGTCTLPYGTEVTLLFLADEGYEPEMQEVALGTLTAEVALAADDLPAAPTRKQLTLTIPAVAHGTLFAAVDGVTNVVTTGACTVPYGAAVTLVFVAEEGYEPALQEVELGAVKAEATLGADQLPAEPTLRMLALTVPEVPNYTAVVVANGVTNAVEAGSCAVPYGADVTVVYQAAPGFEPAQKVVPLGTVTANAEVPAAEVPEEPARVSVTVTVPTVAGATAIVVVNGTTNAVTNGSVQVPYGAEGARVIYLPAQGVTLAGETEIALASPLTGNAAVAAEALPALEAVTFQIVVDNQAKDFGAEDPAFTWHVVNAPEGVTLPEGACVRAPGEAPGEYAIDFAVRSLPAGFEATVNVTKGVLTIATLERFVATGTVTPPKTVTAGKSATWKAVPANGSVFVSWVGADEAGSAALAALDPAKLVKPSISVKAVAGMTRESVRATWRLLDEEVPAGKAAVMTWCDEAQGSVSKSVLVALGKKTSVKATPAKGYVFAGWYADPTLLTPFAFADGKDFREAGHSITVTANTYLYARFVEKSLSADPVTGATYVGTARTDAASSADTWFVGVAVTNLGVSFASASKPAVSVKGLPTGVKWNAKAAQIVGTPTKAGVFSPTITIKNASGATVQVAPTITVVALPDWAQGTYNGACVVSNALGQSSLAISKAGKISGKLLVGAASYTLAADAYTRVEVEEGVTNYVADVAVKNGKALLGTYRLAFRASPKALPLGIGELLGGAAGDAVAELTAVQNAWKRTDLVKAGKVAAIKKTIKITGDALGEAQLTLSFKASGVVSAAGKWSGASASGTAQLLTADLEGDGEKEAEFVLFFKPSKTFPGHARIVPVKLVVTSGQVTAIEIVHE